MYYTRKRVDKKGCDKAVKKGTGYVPWELLQ